MSAACKFMIPRKVNRSSTDLLKILSKTIETSNNINNLNLYTYIDDPYLLPKNIGEKRSYALSRLSGERAANFVANKFPFAFHLHKSFPEISLYDPDFPSPNEADLSEPTVDYLVDLLDHGRIRNAIQIYKSLVANSIMIPLNIKLTLLECLVVLEDDEYTEQSFEELWYQYKPLTYNPWTEMQFALDLFEEIKSTHFSTEDSFSTEESNKFEHSKIRAYSAVINGFARCGLGINAIEIYKQLNISKIPCKFTVCNLIRSTSFLRGRDALDTLRHILQSNSTIKADAKLFSVIFYAISELAKREKHMHDQLIHSTVDCLAEMQRLGIQHSLGSLTNITRILRKTNTLTELPQVIGWAEGLDSFSINEDDDCRFFNEAMDAAYRVGRFDLACKLYNIISSENTSPFLIFSNQSQLRRFYERFLYIAIDLCEDPSEVESLWLKIVSNTYTPSDDLFLRYMDFLQTFQLFNEDWASRLFQSIFQSRAYKRSLALFSKLLYIMRNEVCSENVVLAITSVIMEDEHISSNTQCETLFSDLIFLLARCNHISEICDILDRRPGLNIEKISLDETLSIYLKNVNREKLSDLHNIMKAYGKLSQTAFYEAFNNVVNVIPLTMKERQAVSALSPQSN